MGEAQETQNDHHASETTRIEAFSDGVFAIAITLLVLNIQVPILKENQTLAQGVWEHRNSFIAYILSFLTVLVMWLNHHGLFTLIRKIDRLFLVINGLLLLLICFVNYPTALVAEYTSFTFGLNDATFAALFLNGVYLAIAVVYNLLWNYAARDHFLLDEHVDPALVRQITAQYRYGPLLYGFAMLITLVYAPLGLLVNLSLAVYFAFTGQTERSAPHRQPHRQRSAR